MARREYSPKEKRDALKFAEKLGPSEASRRTGIPKGTLGSWMKKAGIKCDRTERTKAATAARVASFEEKRAALKEMILNRIRDLDSRMDAKHKEFRGQQAKEVWYDTAPSDAIKNYSTSIGILYDKLRKECGEGDPAPTKPSEGEEAKSQIEEYKAALSSTAEKVWSGEEEQCE